MKRVAMVAAGLALAALTAASGWAQGNPRGKASVEVGSAKVSVDYGRPSLKGRKVEDMLGQLPVGGVWRLGADQSTTFSTSGDLEFGSVAVPKGEYSLWARKEADGAWALVFNKQHGQWGTNHDASKDFASAPLKVGKHAETDEVTISLEKSGDGGSITILWGDMELSTSFTAK